MRKLPAAIRDTSIRFESDPSRLGRLIMLVIAGAFVGFAVWATLTEVEIVATATGRIVPQGQVKVIQSPVAGVVGYIHAVEGATVEAGQKLLELDSTDAAADQDRIAAELMIQLVEAARIHALLASDEEREFQPPKDADPHYVAISRNLLLSQLGEIEARKAVNAGQIRVQEANIQSIEVLIRHNESILPLAEEALDMRRRLYEKGLSSKIVYLETSENYLSLKRDLDYQRQQLAEARASLDVLRKEHRERSAAFYRVRFAELEGAQRAITGLEQELVKAQKQKRRHVLLAPVRGVVQDLRVHTIGGVVAPGQRLMIVVPDDVGLEIEALIQNQDIGFVEVGQDVEIKVAAFPFVRYGTIDGELIDVSSDAISAPGVSGADQSSGSGFVDSASSGLYGRGSYAASGPVYRARVTMDRSYIVVDGEEVRLAPGMAVTVDIKTGARRLIEFILSPLLRYRDEAFRER